uniref:Uncharacterized protein n=1 Tax=Plectus sambesii TaxID=2011161 RepID=A0A914UNP2_9BILA
MLALILGCIVAAASGAGWPLMSTIFGGLSNTFLSAQSSFGGDAWNNDSSTSGATMSTITSLNSSASASSGALDQISKELFLSQTIQYCLQYTYLGCGVLVAGYLQIAIWITVSERMMNKIRAKFFEAILRQDIAWFDEKQSGTLVTHLSDAMERIKEGVGDKFGLLIQYVAQFFAGFIIAFIYSWKLTLVMLSLTPLMALSGGFMGKMISSASRREQELYSVAGAIAEEVLSCIRTVIAFNGQKRESDRYENALQTGKVEGVKKSIYTGLGMGVVFLIMFSSYGLAFWYGSTLIASGEIPRGTVFTVLFSVMMGSFALGNAGPSIALIATAKGSAHAIFEIIDRVPAIDAYNRAGKKLAAPRGKIEISNVSFRYPTRPDMTVLNGVSIAAEPGETIALVGSSGCGKSTLVNLLLRYYDVTSGSIKIDGEPIKSLNLKWMRNLIAVVSQEPILFDATVEENIRFGRQNVTHAEMMKVCKMANAHDFISKLPQGYKTEVGERGTQLSGGQKQRIAIARALVRDPKILLLDEATSALDSESESIVQEALEKAAKGRTTIVIAHRLSTIRNADKIVVLAHGEVKEVGTHAELIEKKQLYFDLTYSKTGEELLSGARFWSLMFLGLGVLEAVTWFFSAWLFGVAGENVTMKMRLSVFKNVLRQDVAFFDDPRHSTGKICTRLATDAPNVKAVSVFISKHKTYIETARVVQ